MRTLPTRIALLAFAATIILLIGGRSVSVFYTDLLWFGAAGYPDVFWTRFRATVGVLGVASLVGAAVVLVNLWIATRTLGPVRVRRRYGNLEIAEQVPRTYVFTGVVMAALLAGWWLASLRFGGGAQIHVLAWLRHAQWGVSDPLFGRDASFYVFTLPILLRALDFLALLLAWSFVLCGVAYLLMGSLRWTTGRLEVDAKPQMHFLALLAAFLFVFGLRFWIGQYGLAVQGAGFGGAVGYTDVHARLPAQRILAFLSFAASGAVLLAARRGKWIPAAGAVAVVFIASAVLGQLYPSLVQRFRVEPNELARERAWIARNLEFTRGAYGLQNLERRPFAYAEGALPAGLENSATIERLPLWDAAELKLVFDQVQALQGYYHFPDVDHDRYAGPGGTEQVGLGVREFKADGLPPDKQTWQNLRLNPQFLRGVGVSAVPTSETTSLGQPVLWVGNVDPVQTAAAAPEALRLHQPAVYFGESMSDYAIVADTVTGSPQGVRVDSPLRRLAFAWRYADKNLLLSGAIEENSRILFHRTVQERLETIAPFLVWPDAPESTYPVVHDGRVVWIVDGFSAIAAYPFARATRVPEIGLVRYLRNSVKATVDAVSGEVRIYALDADEPFLRTYSRVFPNVVRPLAEMPAELRAHLRYPALLLAVQADILEEYHLRTAEAFYAGEDVWQLPRGDDDAPYRPMFVLVPPPGAEEPEFLLQVPFIARARQNMTALFVARNDAEHYGELLLFELPREVQVPGPVQVEAVMEQDPVISPQMSLWRQAGSEVRTGRLRLIPLDSSFLYVQPVYLLAQGRPIPELERVIASDGRAVTMAPTLQAALAALRGGESAAPARATTAAPRASAPAGDLPQRALELLTQAEAHLRRGEWAEYGARLRELRAVLERASTGQQ